MVTGGFRTRTGLEGAIRDNACDLVGLGRLAVLNPGLPKEVLNKEVRDEGALFPTTPVTPLCSSDCLKSAGSGLEPVCKASPLFTGCHLTTEFIRYLRDIYSDYN